MIPESPPSAATEAYPTGAPSEKPPPDLGPASSLGFRTPLQEHAPAADTKAAAQLTVLGLMFTLVARYSSHLLHVVSGTGPERLVCLALMLGFGVCSLAAVVQAFRTISPRFPPAPRSLAFFADIASLSREEYIQRVESLTEEEALEQILNFNHTASAICVEKFRQLRRGIRFFQAAFVCWLGLAMFVAIRLLT